MKALSLIQPWATLIAIGVKCVETRSWPTDYRGPLAIHASKWRGANARIIGADYLALCSQEPYCTALTQGGIDRVADLPSGAIVATAMLVKVLPSAEATYRVDEYERQFGNFQPGRFAWFLEQVRPLATPVPFRGMPGLWEVPSEALSVQTSAPEASR